MTFMLQQILTTAIRFIFSRSEECICNFRNGEKSASEHGSAGSAGKREKTNGKIIKAKFDVYLDKSQNKLSKTRGK